MEKLTARAKGLDTLFGVLQRILLICMIVVLCVMAVLSVVHFVNPDAVIGENFNVVDLGVVEVTLAEEFTPSNRTILGYAWVQIMLAVISGGVLYVGLGVIRRILQPMREGNPFHPETARQIRKLAVLALVFGILQNIGGAIDTSVALRAFRLGAALEGNMIRSITANFTFDLGFVVVFFVLLLISAVFAYGAQLQQFSDETL